MRTALLTSLLLLALATPSLAGDADRAADVRTTLAKLDERGGSTDRVARELTGLGPDALPALLAAWRQHTGRHDASDHEPRPVEALRRAIEAQPAAALERHLLAYVGANPGTSARIEALQTVAAFGRRSALSLAIDIFRGADRMAVGSPAVVSAWEAALRTLFEDRAPVTRLLAAWRNVPAPLHVPTARVLAENDTRTTVGAALTIMQRADENIPELIGVLEGASPVVLAKLPVMAALLEVRSHRNRNVRRATAHLMGRLGRDDAFTPLVQLLDDEDGSVQRAAATALRTLTGASAGGSAAAWKRWYDAERDWLKQSRMAELLRSDKPAETARALRELHRHAFIGAKHVALVQRLADDGSDGVRLLALATLERMGRASVAPDLVRHLNDGDAAFRTAVWKTLRALTGEDLPATYRDWSDATKRWRS
jgi:HEAT repeat protein